MAVGTVAGSKMYIGVAGASILSPDVSSPDVWTEIKPIRSLGDLSQTFDGITVESVGDGDSYDLKGVRKYPNFELTLNQDDTDAGQIALKAASAAVRGTLYPFKILNQDGVGQVTWQGEVFGYGPAYGGVGDLRTVRTSISIRPATVTLVQGL
jgi:hypothetical protein